MASIKYMISQMVDEREKWSELLGRNFCKINMAAHQSTQRHTIVLNSTRIMLLNMVLGASAHITVGQRKIVLSTSKIMSHFWSRKD